MNLFNNQTQKNLIGFTLTIFIALSSFAGIIAIPSEARNLTGNSSTPASLPAGNPDAGFTVTKDTTINQAISLYGNILVKSGNTLTVNGKFNLSSGTLTIESGATIIVNNLLEIHGGWVVLQGGRLIVQDLSILNANRISGSGGIKIENSFSNQSSKGWAGQSLTASNNVKVCYNTTQYFGNGVQTCSDPLFDQVLPIKVVKNSFRFNKIIRNAQ